jgi:hypothetical protein
VIGQGPLSSDRLLQLVLGSRDPLRDLNKIGGTNVELLRIEKLLKENEGFK